MALSKITLPFLFILIFCSTRIWSSRNNVGNHVILKRQINLLQGGVETPLSTMLSNQRSQCLMNEHGPNCTYCVPSDSCEGGHFTCDVNTGNKICLPGYRGDNCQLSTDLVNEYHVTCPENTCRNGGTCTSGRCCCRNGFTGILCEIEIIECKNQSCLNGGICKDLIGKFECLCKPSFHGKNCELRIDHVWTTPSGDSSCQSHSCHNNGTCLEDTFLTYCLCPTYYTGNMCELRLGKSSASSTCPQNYFGNQCKIYCKPQDNCFGHFVCDERTGNKICLSGWHGLNCDTRTIPQNVDPVCPKHGCKNDGQCFDKHCCCRHNYTGEYCQVESIGCLSSPCKNNATCVNQGNGFVCVCQSNFTGKLCESDIKIARDQITTTIANAFTLSTSANAKEEKGNLTKNNIQHTFVTNVQSSHFRPISSIYLSYSTVDVSKSKANQISPTPESRIPSAESLYFQSVSLLTTFYSSPNLEAFSSMYYTNDQKQSSLPSISANLKSISSHFFIPTSSTSSFSTTSLPPSSSYFHQSSVFLTRHITSSSMSPLLVTESLHPGYLNSFANKISASASRSVITLTSSDKAVDITNYLSVFSLTQNAAPTSSVSSYDISRALTGSITDERTGHHQHSRSASSLFSQTAQYSLSDHALPSGSYSRKQSSALPQTLSVISPTPTNMIKSSVSAMASSSIQERSVASTSYLQQLQYKSIPEPAATGQYTSDLNFVQISSERVTILESSFSESVSPFTSINVINNSGSDYYRTNSHIPLAFASTDLSKNSSKVSSIGSDRLLSSSSSFTGFAVPSTLTNYHLSATSDLWNFSSSSPLFSNTEIIYNTHAISFEHILKPGEHITELIESAQISPTKTSSRFTGSVQVSNTQYRGITFAVTGTLGTRGGEVLKTIDQPRVIDPSKASVIDHSNIYTKPSYTVNTRSQDILNKHFDNVTKSSSGDQSSKSIMITELNGNTESSGGLPKTWVIVLVVVACIAFLVAVIFLVVYLSVRQRRKDSRTISQSPSEIHEFSKEHFSEQPDFNNPTYDFENDSDDDSVKYDIYVVNE